MSFDGIQYTQEELDEQYDLGYEVGREFEKINCPISILKEIIEDLQIRIQELEGD